MSHKMLRQKSQGQVVDVLQFQKEAAEGKVMRLAARLLRSRVVHSLWLYVVLWLYLVFWLYVPLLLVTRSAAGGGADAAESCAGEQDQKADRRGRDCKVV
jgi:hypothetical protein